MRFKTTLYLILVVILCAAAVLSQPVDPKQKLGAFLGKWQTEGAFTANPEAKITTELECRWSPFGAFLVCEQNIKMAAGDHRQRAEEHPAQRRHLGDQRVDAHR